ncbi:MAG TPA: HEAT repeat domain-containing protein [Bacillota bacterium]|nr:HEAT repeat domain-containing protein [Bacillota bacterium]
MKLRIFSLVLSVMVGAALIGSARAETAVPPAEKQRQLLQVLQSAAPAAEKAITCKQLAIYGTKDAVPALAALLSDPQLASWARIALEANPDPAVDEALRQATGKLQGKLLVGVINSIGVRRDAKAVSELTKRLPDSDVEVASAAAVALGHIGGSTVAKTLKKSLSSVPEAVRPAVAEGCIFCAEGFLRQGKASDAVALYDLVRRANVPKQKTLEATRGAILARQSKGLPLLLEQLRSSDKGLESIGLRTARELPGRGVTEALAAELERTSPERQALLLLAIGDRTDVAVLPAVLKAAQSGPQKLRLVAIGVLDRSGNVASLPVLLEAAASDDAQLAPAALAALARLPGNEVDADVLARLPQSAGKTRQVLIQLVGLRRIEGGLAVILKYAQDTHAGVRSAVIQTIGALGEDKEVADLVGLAQKTQNAAERSDIEMALIGISGRSGTRCVPHLLGLARCNETALRIIALHALANAGGPDALAVVIAAVNDKDEALQDEAVRTLSTWPNNWPEDKGVVEPFLALAKSSKKSHQVLAVRGYLQYVQGDKQLKANEKAAQVKDVLPLIQRPEEKRLAIAVLDSSPSAQGMDLLVMLAGQPEVAEEAANSIVKLAGKKAQAFSKQQRQKALQVVVEKAQSDATKKKAEELLKTIQ